VHGCDEMKVKRGARCGPAYGKPSFALSAACPIVALASIVAQCTSDNDLLYLSFAPSTASGENARTCAGSESRRKARSLQDPSTTFITVTFTPALPRSSYCL
jgi:hypothetical protein